MANDWKEWSNHVLAELKRFDKNHESIHDKIDKMDSRLDKYNETLIRNTISLEDHILRTNLLEKKMEHVESEVDGLKSHMISIRSFTNIVKLISSARGKVIIKALIGISGAVASYHMGLKDFILSLLK